MRRSLTPSRWVLAGILLGLVVLKASYNPYPFRLLGTDGAYYYQVARHVSEGDGLLTSVALYHQGLRQLPHASPIYPLWPLVLGGTGALVGLDRATMLLPEVLYVVSLGLLYALTHTIVRTWREDAVFLLPRSNLLTMGHVAVLVFGLNRVYFKFTSLPFTEALAFCLTFLTLLALARTSHGRPVRWAALAALLAGLTYLTRAQSLGLVLMVPLALALTSVRNREYRPAAVIAVAVSISVILPWILYLVLVVGNFTPRMLLDFMAYRETPELKPYRLLMEFSSPVEWLVDKAIGVVKAFDPTRTISYVESFGVNAYIPLLAVGSLMTRPKTLFDAMRAAIQPEFIVVAGTLLGMLLCLAPTHAAHAWHDGWLFGFRHGLPFGLLIVVSAAYLLADSRKVVRIVVFAMMAVSLVTGASALRGEFQKDYPPPTASEYEFASWLAEQDPPPVFIATRPLEFGAITRGRFHEVVCEESTTQMETYFRLKLADHVITFDDEHCPFFTGVRDALEEVRTFGTGPDKITVWRLRQGR